MHKAQPKEVSQGNKSSISGGNGGGELSRDCAHSYWMENRRKWKPNSIFTIPEFQSMKQGFHPSSDNSITGEREVSSTCHLLRGSNWLSPSWIKCLKILEVFIISVSENLPLISLRNVINMSNFLSILASLWWMKIIYRSFRDLKLLGGLRRK